MDGSYDLEEGKDPIKPKSYKPTCLFSVMEKLQGNLLCKD